ncbi:MAG: hypothetical protein GY815_11690 [Gammaproteobacteria bacterium]|nr:hypothetical protein [Gammaproteobacteria bacterium]
MSAAIALAAANALAEAKQSFSLRSSIWRLPRRWRSFMPFGYLCPLGIYALWVFMPFGYRNDSRLELK